MSPNRHSTQYDICPATAFAGPGTFQYCPGFCQETANIDVHSMDVKLIEVSAAAPVTGTFLSRSTTEELNSEHFEVQRSIYEPRWTAARISLSQHRYTCPTTDQDSQTIYYRLKIVDLNGSYFQFSCQVRTSSDVSAIWQPHAWQDR